MAPKPNKQSGFTLIEVLVAVTIAAMLMVAVGGLISHSLQARAALTERESLVQEAHFAVERMVAAVRGTRRLLLPLPDNPGTAWSESLRDPGVLAVTLDPTVDRDADGFADADNDKDGQVDEDFPNDATNDAESGLINIDDDGDGTVDERPHPGELGDDDEDGQKGEDPLDGTDNDGDGAVDEDMTGDHNKDSQPGVAGVDDDGDSQIDEGHIQDDDEDGSMNEDWLDPVVYFLNGTELMERMPNLNPADGTDHTERVVAENVSRFVVERVAAARAVLIDVTLQLTGPSGEAVSLNTRVRVGGAR